MLESDGWWDRATAKERASVRWWVRHILLAGRDHTKTSDAFIDLFIASLSPEKIEEMKRRAFEAQAARDAVAAIATASLF